jgi:hypothetical protein
MSAESSKQVEMELVPVSLCVVPVLDRLRKVVAEFHNHVITDFTFIRYELGVLNYRGYDTVKEEAVSFNVNVWSFEVTYHYLNSLEISLCNLNSRTEEELGRHDD